MGAGIIVKPLTYIFNLSVCTDTVPISWKQAYITPLLKFGDPCDANNYRPISNLSVLAKVLDILVSDQLRTFLVSLNILNNIQSGFRSGHSTVSAA